MTVRNIVISLIVAMVAGLIGFLAGPSIPTRTSHPTPTAQLSQSAPQLIAPIDNAEFVESDLQLTWDWQPALTDAQRFVVRVWADGRDPQEIWTVERVLNVKDPIDSFSIGVGVFFWQVAVVNTGESGGFESMASEWSAPSKLLRVRRLSIPARAYEDLSPAGKYFRDLDLSASDTIDAVHRFIQTNSILDQQKTYDADYSDAIELMFNYAEGKSEEQPFLQCDGRSTSMLTILQELGIESRLVFLYRPVPGYLSQHTTLEVFNPDTQKWQVHDLNWDFYYVDAETMERVSAERILFGSRETLLGCPMEGGDCTVEVMEESSSYFDALRYGYTFELWVNPERFDLSTRFEGQENKNLVEFLSGDDPQRVTIRMDNWDFPVVETSP